LLYDKRAQANVTPLSVPQHLEKKGEIKGHRKRKYRDIERENIGT
jgi:hypothetical protein